MPVMDYSTLNIRIQGSTVVFFFFNGEGEKGKFFFTIECQLISPMENTNTPCLLKGYFENNIAPPSVDFSSKMFHVNMKILFMLFIVT